MDNLLFLFLRTVLIFAVVGFIWRLARKEKPPENPGHIKLPRMFLTVGIIVTVFFFCVIAGAFFFAESQYLSLAFLPFLSLGLIIVICSYNWEIRITENTATYRSMFRRYYVFTTEDVKSIRITKNVVRIKVKNKTFNKIFWIDTYAMNLQSLASFLRKNPELRNAIHQGRHLLR